MITLSGISYHIGMGKLQKLHSFNVSVSTFKNVLLPVIQEQLKTKHLLDFSDIDLYHVSLEINDAVIKKNSAHKVFILSATIPQLLYY